MRKLLFLATTSLALAACGPGFDPASEVKTLRVFSVQKDAPYPEPNQTVSLSLLWDDAKGKLDAMGNKSERPVQLAWLKPCTNPGNDLYAGCFQQFVQVAQQDPLSLVAKQGDARTSSTFSFQVPSDIIEAHAPAPPGTPTYGLVYSFFALCAGELAFEVPKSAGGLPLVCKDGDKYLGSDDFVVGYSSLYTFADANVQNKNPIIKGLDIAGTQFLNGADTSSAVCFGPACVPDAPLPLEASIDCSASENAGRCVDACSDDGGDKCPDIKVTPLLDGPAERDDVSKLYYGRDYGEQMWVNYYATGGKFGSDTRLLNDAQRGWNSDPGAKFRAPKATSPVTLWVVVHDNRGGIDWARVELGIR